MKRENAAARLTPFHHPAGGVPTVTYENPSWVRRSNVHGALHPRGNAFHPGCESAIMHMPRQRATPCVSSSPSGAFARLRPLAGLPATPEERIHVHLRYDPVRNLLGIVRVRPVEADFRDTDDVAPSRPLIVDVNLLCFNFGRRAFTSNHPPLGAAWVDPRGCR